MNCGAWRPITDCRGGGGGGAGGGEGEGVGVGGVVRGR